MSDTIHLVEEDEYSASFNSEWEPIEPHRVLVVADITASATDAGDTLDIYIDWSLDEDVYYNGVHFTQQAGDGSAKTMVAVLDPSNPGTSVIDVTSDCASGAVRPALFGSFIRARVVIVDSGDANSAHTFSVKALYLDD